MGIFDEEIRRIEKEKRLEKIALSTDYLLRKLPVELALREKVEGESERQFRDKVLEIQQEICFEFARQLESQKHLFSSEEFKVMSKILFRDIYPEYWAALSASSEANPTQFTSYERALIQRHKELKNQYA